MIVWVATGQPLSTGDKIMFAGSNGQIGSVYILQFVDSHGNPVKLAGRAQFYIGWAKDVETRLACHRTGNKAKGAAITAAVIQQGYSLRLIHVIPNVSKYFERALKNTKSAATVISKLEADYGDFMNHYSARAAELALANAETYA
jgi:hypothetical protein